jgi:hypothetical protein
VTRKDYVLIAAALKAAMSHAEGMPTEQAGIEEAARELCSALASDNPRFDRARFLKAAIARSMHQ